jgi:2-polyprenyl-6-methoxyphenol hydroxylase-like FAD-dependent oxidoreductase
VNLAIQDAIAAANILAEPLRNGTLMDKHLHAVQKRRNSPTKATQKVQLMMRRRPQGGKPSSGPPAFMRLIARSRLFAASDRTAHRHRLPAGGDQAVKRS